MRHTTALSVVLTASALMVSAAPSVHAEEGAPSDVETDTVLVFEDGVALSRLAETLAAIGARPVEFFHESPGGGGGYFSNEVDLSVVIHNYAAGYQAMYADEPAPFGVRLAGPTDLAVGAVAALPIVNSVVVPSGETIYVAPAAEGADVRVVDGDAAAASTPSGSWSPDYGTVDNFDDTGVEFFSGNLGFTREEARGIKHTLTFDHDNPGGRFAADWAYEHDYKLYNGNNWDLQACPANQRSDFWAFQDDGIVWDTDMPARYLDTGASDECTWHDITVGSYRPTEFERRTYWIDILVAQGDTDRSDFQLRGYVLDKDCEFSPWCVGIGGYSEPGPLLIGTGPGEAPGCRRWAVNQDSAAC